MLTCSRLSIYPHASTTDDVECFFSIMKQCMGKSFTLKRVRDEWMKMCIEFNIRLDNGGDTICGWDE